MSTIPNLLPVTVHQQQGFNSNILNVGRFDIPIASVTSSFTTPCPLMSAISGYFYLPIWAELIRTGNPYLTAPGNLRLEYSGLAGTAILLWGGSTLTTAGTSNISAIASIIQAQGGTTETGSQAWGSVKFASATGNPTVNGASPGSDLIIVVGYYIIPVVAANVGSY